MAVKNMKLDRQISSHLFIIAVDFYNGITTFITMVSLLCAFL